MPTGSPINPGVETRIARLRATARERLEPSVYDYFAGGSGTEISLDESTRAWRDHRFRPRVLRDVSSVDTSVDLLGTTLASPVGVAPMGYQQLLHADGEVAAATGSGTHLFVLSTRSDRAIEDVAAAAERWWFQVYATADRAVGDALVDRAVASGTGALVLTGDTPYPAAKARAGRPRALDSAAEQNRAVTEAEIGRLGERSGLPVLVKGVLRADDARRCLDAGAAGLVVSNHGGRQLDRALAAADALADVVAAADGAPVLVDGGIRSGHDVLTALALGARAVLIGRPVAWALAAGGTDEVGGLLAAMTAETADVLGLAGCRSCAEASPDLVQRPRRIHPDDTLA